MKRKDLRRVFLSWTAAGVLFCSMLTCVIPAESYVSAQENTEQILTEQNQSTAVSSYETDTPDAAGVEAVDETAENEAGVDDSDGVGYTEADG